MKIFRTDESQAIRCLPDTALLIRQRPFFIPDFATRCTAALCLAVPVNRLGRSIHHSFAHRYYCSEEWSLAVHFEAVDLGENLRAKSLPDDIAWGFDNAVAYAGSTVKVAMGDEVVLCTASERVDISVPRGIAERVDKSIAHISTYYTLRQGDLLLFPLTSQRVLMYEDSALSLNVNGNTEYGFSVK